MALGTQPLSEDEMRRTWALVGLLTSLKRRANHPPPTAELILRKFDALSLPALDTLSILCQHLPEHIILWQSFSLHDATFIYLLYFTRQTFK